MENKTHLWTLILLALLICPGTMQAGGSISLLGEETSGAVSSSSAQASFTPTQRTISTIAGPDGIRNANFNLYTQNGTPYVNPSDFGQVFQGSTMTSQNGQYCVQRPNGGQLTFIIVMQQLVILFLGAQAETGVPVYQQNGQVFIPINQFGQFYGQQFSPTGSQLTVQPTNQRADWLQNSWQNTLQQNGAMDYQQQISNASNLSGNSSSSSQTTPQGQVFRDIVATVFSSEESGLKGAYGEWLRPNDLYVALPKRFSGTRPKVAVQGPAGTHVAEIKDVGPWNINDPYWVTGSRPQAESGYDLGQTRSGRRRTNLAGIDLSYRLGELVGIKGKGKVNWWFAR